MVLTPQRGGGIFSKTKVSVHKIKGIPLAPPAKWGIHIQGCGSLQGGKWMVRKQKKTSKAQRQTKFSNFPILGHMPFSLRPLAIIPPFMQPEAMVPLIILTIILLFSLSYICTNKYMCVSYYYIILALYVSSYIIIII